MATKIVNGVPYEENVDADFNKNFFQRIKDFFENLYQMFRERFILR